MSLVCRRHVVMKSGKIAKHPDTETGSNNTENRIKVSVKFSDNSGTYEGTYQLEDTVNDVIADIMVDTKIIHVYDPETGIIIDEDTKLSTLQKENCLDKLGTRVNDDAVKYAHSIGEKGKGPIGNSASLFEQDTEKIGSVNPGGHKCSIDDHAENRVKLSVKFSDNSQKYEGTYRLEDTVADIRADIMMVTKNIHVYDHETGITNDEDTKLSTLQKENRLVKLGAIVSDDAVKYAHSKREKVEGPIGNSASLFEQDTEKKGSVNPGGHKCSIDDHAGKKVEVSVKFSDYSPKHVGKYLLKNTVYDILAYIMTYKRISKICDSVTKMEIHENTKISTLLKENRLHQLMAMVVVDHGGYPRLREESTKKIRSNEGVYAIGGVIPDGNKYPTDTITGAVAGDSGYASCSDRSLWRTDVQKHASHKANKVKVSIRFSDYSPKYEGKYRLDDTVYDIIADIRVGRKISHIFDSETGEMIHEDTQLSTLQKENRLDRLRARTSERGATSIPEKSSKKIPSNKGIQMIGGGNPDGQKYSLDAHAGCLPIEEFMGFPYDEVSDYVGPEGKTFNIGECSVTFPPGCFEKTQRVTVSVSINPDKWPNGKVGITPTLHVKAHDLKVPAIVKMKTWCVDDDDEDLLVEVLRFDEDEKEWNIAHLCQLGQSRDIEFQVGHFSKFSGFLKKLFLSYYALRSIVCFDNDKFAIATVLDNKTAKRYCIKKLKKKIGTDATINSYNPFHCKYSTTIRSRIFSEHHESDFTFTPTDVEHTVQRVNQCRGSFKSYLILESKKEPTEVTLSFHVFANKTRLENQAFKYFWRPVKHRPTSEQTESNFPGTSAGNFHAGGDMHLHFDGRKTTGVENHGEMTSHNEGCSEAISG